MLQKLSKLFREFKLAGIDWIMAAGAKSQGCFAFNVTSGGTPDTVLFSALNPPLPNMASNDYQVLVNGETTNRTNVDHTTKAATGFDILGGTAAEHMNVIVIGRIAGMPSE